MRRLIRAVVHRLIEREGIPPIERGIAVLLFREDILEDHLGDLGDDFGHLHILFFDLVVDLLLLVGQEYIHAAVLLHEHLPHKNFERFFDASL